MKQPDEFEAEVRDNVARMTSDASLHRRALEWITATAPYKYIYNFRWLGRPIIQLPQDIEAMQEIIWSAEPRLIIETGIAHGGSLVLSASMLALLDYREALERGEMLDPSKPRRKVLGIDIDIRSHNRAAIKAHPMANRIEMIEGSSTEPDVITHVREYARGVESILVCLDSNHTHAHVLAELEAYAPLVTKGSYCVVFDTSIEDVPNELSADRPWGKGNSPKTAVWEYLETHPEFEIDKTIQQKLLITAALDGYLRRTK